MTTIERRMHWRVVTAFGLLAVLASAQITGITLHSANETIYFKTVAGTLRGVVLANVTKSTAGTAAGTLSITAGGETVTAPVTIVPGTTDLVGYCRQIWPAPPTTATQVVLTVGAQSAQISGVTIGAHRPWDLHLAMDKHVDYVWLQGTEQQTRAAMESLLDVYLSAIETDKASGLHPHDEQTHFSFDQTIWWDAWTLNRPAQVNRLVNAEATDHLGVGALYAVLLTQCLGTEDLIRAIYPARAVQRQFGVDVDVAVPMETTSIPWGLATVCHGAGVPFVTKGECACADQPSAYGAHSPTPMPLFDWVGPDGNAVLLKWDTVADNQFFGGYAECYRLWADGSDSNPLTPAQRSDILQVLNRYEGFGSAYPLDQIMLYGLGWDFWTVGPSRLDATIRAWNAEVASLGYEYPRLKNSRAAQFFQAAEASLAQHATNVPQQSGDFGADWDVWMLYHMWAFERGRSARDTLPAAETASAIASLFDPSLVANHQSLVTEAWKRLMVLVEHTAANYTPTANDAGSVAQLKKDCATTALGNAATVFDQSLDLIAARVRTGDQLEGPTLLVYNPTQYGGDLVVDAPVTTAGPYAVTDLATGALVPSQVGGSASAWVLHFIAPGVPGLGYRTFRATPGAASGGNPVQVSASAGVIENQFYRVTVSPQSGAIVSLRDKTRGNRELVNGALGTPGVNALRAKGAVPTAATITAADVGAVSGSLRIATSASGHGCVTTVTLHDGIDRVDIRNDVTRPAGSDPTDEVVFDFPWNLTQVQHRYEAGAAIVRPGFATQSPPGDHLPGSTQGYFAVQHWIDTAGLDALGGSGGVRLSTPDAYMFSLGTTTTWNNPQVASPRVNVIGYDNQPPNGDLGLGDQADETQFTFRFALQGYSGTFDGAADARLAYPHARDPKSRWLPANQPGALPADRHQFVALDSDAAVLTALKVAEEGLAQGFVARFWNAGIGGAAGLNLGVGALAAGSVRALDLLERNQGSASNVTGAIPVSVPLRGFATRRILPGTANAAPTANAGTNQAVNPGALVTLNGSASFDPDDVPSFRWVQVGGKRVALATPSAVSTTFIAPAVANPAEGALRFQLVVDDARHLPATALVAVTVAVDPTPPSAPPTLQALAVGQTITLTWSAASDPESGISSYRIYRGLGPATRVFLTQVSATSTYADLGLLPNQPYSYEVHALNGGGLEGSASPVAVATTGDDPPPPPTGLGATSGAGVVHLSWNAVTVADLQGYRVYRAAAAAGPFALQGQPGLATSFDDSSVSNGTTYYYVVRSFDASQESVDSAVAPATPQSTPPPAPATLQATPGNQSVTLAWSAVTAPNLIGYRVYRRIGAAGVFELSADVGQALTFTDQAAVNGTLYGYVVRARGIGTESGNSPLATATPTATTTLTMAIAQDDHDATSVNDVVRVGGYATSDRADYVSNDGEIESAAMLFALPIPPGAQITAAAVTVKAGAYQNADPAAAMQIQVYDVGNVPPFVNGAAIDLLNHQPVFSTVVPWAAGSAWANGSLHTTAALTTLVQHVVDRPDWASGNRLGFVVTEGSLPTGRYYGWRDFAAGAGDAATLTVSWSAARPAAPSLTLTPLQIGHAATMVLSGGTAGDAFGIEVSAAPAYLPLPPYGNLLIDLGSSFELIAGSLPAGGALSLTLGVPSDPLLVGFTTYVQGYALHAGPVIGAALTNLVVRTVQL